MDSAAVSDLLCGLEAAGRSSTSVCYALQGSAFINATEFTNLKNFVLDFVPVLAVDDDAEVSGCQYSSCIRSFEKLTVHIGRLKPGVDGSRKVPGVSTVALI